MENISTLKESRINFTAKLQKMLPLKNRLDEFDRCVTDIRTAIHEVLENDEV